MFALCILQCAEHANQNMLGALKYAQSNHFWTEAFACTSMLITANIRYSEHAPDSHFWCKDKGSQPIGICSCEHARWCHLMVLRACSGQHFLLIGSMR